MTSVTFQPTPGPVAVRPPRAESSPDPVCDRCGRAAGRTHAVSPSRRLCWGCFDRHLTNLPPRGEPS